MRRENVYAFSGKARGKKNRKPLVGVLFIFFALALFAYYLASPLALVEKVAISGNSFLQSSHLAELAGIKKGMHMWRLKLREGEDKLKENPWIVSAQIRRQFPNTVSITVEERMGAAIVMTESGNWLVAQDGITLAESTGFQLPWLTGLTLDTLSPGVPVEGRAVGQALIWAGAFQPIASQISEINMADYPVLITLYTTDGYKAIFAADSIPTERVEDFAALLDELRRSKQKGIIDFRGLPGRGIFTPWPGNPPGK